MSVKANGGYLIIDIGVIGVNNDFTNQELANEIFDKIDKCKKPILLHYHRVDIEDDIEVDKGIVEFFAPYNIFNNLLKIVLENNFLTTLLRGYYVEINKTNGKFLVKEYQVNYTE